MNKQILAAWFSRKSLVEIAEDFNITVEQVSAVLRDEWRVL